MDLIDRQAAIDAVKAIKFGLWEIDIPSPTVPEYREHHEQVTELMGVCDCWIKKLTEYQSVQPDGIPLEWIDKHLEWLDSCDNDLAQLAIVSIRRMVELWKIDRT